MSHSTESIRNFALAGHAGSGKTLLLEAMLREAGAIASCGSIERGTTLSDHDPQEKQRGHSIDTSIAGFVHGDCRMQVIDTPGYADFRGPALAALSAVETCVVVVNALAGVQHGTRRLMHYAKERGMARTLVVNHIDAEGADLPGLVAELRATFGNECLPVNLPAQGASRVADCFFSPGGEADFSSVADAHREIIDQVVEINERVMERYLEDGEGALGGDELHRAFEQCLREGHLVPICFTSARSGAGVREFLDFARKLLPDPAEGNPPVLLKGAAAEPVELRPDPARHVVARVFKIVNDPFAGKLGIFRVYQGTLRRDAALFVDDGRKPFKVGHLFRVHGKEHVEIDEAVPGDIAAVAKVEEIHHDAVLHDSHDEDQLRVAPLPFPQPMFGLAVTPKQRGQEQKLAQALARLGEEDPCFRTEHHKELNETVIRGLGDLHLKVMLERMQLRHGVEVDTAPPRIAYRETIGTGAEGHHRHKKQTGGAGQFGEVLLRVEPLPRGAGFEFVDEIKGGAIPGQFLPAIEKGVRQALETGAIAGHPMQDLRVVVTDGKHHPVDSKEVAFVSAGRRAFLDAVSRARPLVLEPIVNIDVSLPADSVGDVTGALAAKRARILGTDTLRGGSMLIKAQAPLAELVDYQTELKAMTGGEGRFLLEPSHYEAVPPAVQKALVEAWKPAPEED